MECFMRSPHSRTQENVLGECTRSMSVEHGSIHIKKRCVCCQMELRAAGPSTPSFIQDEEGNIIDSRGGGSDPVQFVFEDIHWTSEISREEAARRLEVTFYPFKKVSYLPFSEAFQRAQEESKLVHSILLWGALDDQSC
nr:selenoprotein N-like isoform X1 [Salvelinus alpinus]